MYGHSPQANCLVPTPDWATTFGIDVAGSISVEFSAKSKPEKAIKKVDACRYLLLPEEEVRFYGPAINFRPTVDSILLTNARLLMLFGDKLVIAATYDRI